MSNGMAPLFPAEIAFATHIVLLRKHGFLNLSGTKGAPGARGKLHSSGPAVLSSTDEFSYETTPVHGLCSELAQGVDLRKHPSFFGNAMREMV